MRLHPGRADVGVLFQRLMTPDLNAYPLVEERYLLAVPMRRSMRTSVCHSMTKVFIQRQHQSI